MAYKSQKDMNPSKIIGIQFSVLSPNEIRKGSVAEITSRDTYTVSYTHLTLPTKA